MLSIASLITKLAIDFPQFEFVASDQFRWTPGENKIFYKESSQDSSYLLHELAHALLVHTTYQKDVNLLEMERDAWQYAVDTLANVYGISIQENIIQDSLDTYRDWLHSRSTCPSCRATGMQIGSRMYQCIACKNRWKVNEARSCALRRYQLKEKDSD